MKKIMKIDWINLNERSLNFFYRGYNLYFMHGWFCSYLSAPSDSEEDLVIPSYLVLDENKIIDEKEFTKFIDEIMAVYVGISDNIFEKNKQIKPLGSLTSINDFSIEEMDISQKSNLLIWLYGYLCGYLVIGTDITDYFHDENLLENKFFPALYTVCSAFLMLDQELDIKSMFTKISYEDYLDVKADIIDLWDGDNGITILDELSEITLDDVLSDFVNALNTIFYVVRVADETRFAKQTPLLKNLLVH